MRFIYTVYAVTVLFFFSSEISGPPGGHLSCHRLPWKWQCHAEQYASLRFYLPQPDGGSGFCRSQICQQAGLSFPGLCHYLNCLHLCRGIKIHDSSPRIPVSLQDRFARINMCLNRKLGWIMGSCFSGANFVWSAHYSIIILSFSVFHDSVSLLPLNTCSVIFQSNS